MRAILAGFCIEGKHAFACIVKENKEIVWLRYIDLHKNLTNCKDFILVNVDSDILKVNINIACTGNIGLLTPYIINGDNLPIWNMTDGSIEPTGVRRLVYLYCKDGVHTVMDADFKFHEISDDIYELWKKQYHWYDWGHFYSKEEIDDAVFKIQKFILNTRNRASVMGSEDVFVENYAVVKKLDRLVYSYKWLLYQAGRIIKFNARTESDIGHYDCDNNSFECSDFIILLHSYKPNSAKYYTVDNGLIFSLYNKYNCNFSITHHAIVLDGTITERKVCDLAEHIYFGEHIRKIETLSSLQRVKRFDFRSLRAEQLEINGLCQYCSNLREVFLPPDLDEIGRNMFRECINLATIDLSNIRKINDSAFETCKHLKNLIWGDKLREIGRHAFYKCSGLRNVIIQDGVQTIGKCAFLDCIMLEHVKVSSGVTVIPDSCFAFCYTLKDVELSQNITAIEAKAFRNCLRLRHITIPKKVTKETLGKWAFSADNFDSFDSELKNWLMTITDNNTAYVLDTYRIEE